MKQADEVEALKRSWRSDPHWDLAETEGFEEHREELSQYEESCKKQWERELASSLPREVLRQNAHWAGKLHGLVVTLSERIAELEAQLTEAQARNDQLESKLRIAMVERRR